MLNIYNLVLFLHVSSDIGIFIGIGAQILTLTALRRAKDIGQARSLIRLIKLSEPISIISGLVLLASGLYLALTHWSFQNGWIIVAFGSLILVMPLLIRGVVEPRMQVIITMTQEAQDGPLPESLYKRIHDPVLGAGIQTLGAFVLGIVFLMTTKPALVGSIIVIVSALTLGLLSSLPLRRQA